MITWLSIRHVKYVYSKQFRKKSTVSKYHIMLFMRAMSGFENWCEVSSTEAMYKRGRAIEIGARRCTRKFWQLSFRLRPLAY